MKKIRYNTNCGPELLHLDQVEPPSLGKSQVLVRVHLYRSFGAGA